MGVGFSRAPSVSDSDDNNNIHISFGPPFNVSLEEGHKPCFSDGDEGAVLWAAVAWWGCGDDAFDLRQRTSDASKTGRWLWLERRSQRECGRILQTRHLRLRPPASLAQGV